MGYVTVWRCDGVWYVNGLVAMVVLLCWVCECRCADLGVFAWFIYFVPIFFFFFALIGSQG